MSDRDQRIEGLHQKASAHYLQGDTASAQAAWRELLAMRPDDERALEGVRLCEMLAEESGPSFAVPTPADTDRPATPPSVPTDPPRQAEGRDLGDADATSALELAAPSAPPASPGASGADAFDFDFSDPGPDATSTELEAFPPPAAVAQGATTPGEAAAAELANRTMELVDEATTAYEEGRRDDALALIARVYILDDDNSAARSLEEIIKAEIEAEQEPAEPPEPAAAAERPAVKNVLDLNLSEPDDDAAADGLAGPPGLAPTAESAAASLDPAADLPEDLAEPLTGLDDGLELDGEELPVPLPVPVKKKAALPGWALIAAGLIVVVGGVVYFARGLLGEDPAPAPTAEELMPAPAPEIPADMLPPEDDPAAPAHTPEQAEQLQTLLARAQAAFDGEDYAAAVISLGQAIEIAPGNVEAQQQLALAGERYRAQKERDDKWQEAIRSFNEGGYRNALKIFYRLPAEGEQEQARLSGYRRNAWYNMGVVALRSRDCAGALSNFEEARDLDPADGAVLAAIDLAHRCGTGDRGFNRDVERLRERGLED